MFEIYAPWCGYCQRLESTWTQLSQELEGTNVKVARTNGEKFKDISIRFLISGYPSIFHIKDGQVRHYPTEKGRELPAFTNFANKGWSEVDPIPFYLSPLGFPGSALATTAIIADVVEQVYNTWANEYKLPLWGFLAVLLSFVLVFTILLTLTLERCVRGIAGLTRKKKANTPPKTTKRE
uniref:Thioredoxin domain-containing protein n=1 Tax=Arcella intermedia TaxID=1963864 RepID=A0A6B2LKK8_9EUKA